MEQQKFWIAISRTCFEFDSCFCCLPTVTRTHQLVTCFIGKLVCCYHSESIFRITAQLRNPSTTSCPSLIESFTPIPQQNDKSLTGQRFLQIPQCRVSLCSINFRRQSFSRRGSGKEMIKLRKRMSHSELYFIELCFAPFIIVKC